MVIKYLPPILLGLGFLQQQSFQSQLQECYILVLLCPDIQQTEAKLLAQLAEEDIRKHENSRLTNGYDWTEKIF